LNRYYITDRKAAGGTEKLLRIIDRQFQCGIKFLQIREKDLSGRELFELTRKVVAQRGTRATKILVNSRADVALAAGADGVHLPAAAPEQTLPGLLVGRSCHTVQEVLSSRADLVTFGPVFESPGKGPPTGLDALRDACRFQIAVYALGGITWNNALECIEAGAAGVAGIRLFQEMGSDALR
jgi:thiamine-phosphate pyrophosphorylase